MKFFYLVITFLFTFISASLSLSAQEVELTLGPPTRNLDSSFRSKTSVDKIIDGRSYNYSYYITEHWSKGETHLELRTNEKITETVILEEAIPYKGMLDARATYYLQDSLYLLVAYIDDKQTDEILYLLSSYIPNQHKLSQPREITRVKYTKSGFPNAVLKPGAIKPAIIKNKYTARLSPDSSKVLISYLRKKTQEAKETMFLQVWANNFESKLWEKEIELPLNKETTQFDSIYIDNDANAFLLFHDVQKTRENNEIRNYHLSKVSQLGNEVSHQTLDIGEYEIKDIHLFFDKEGDMIGTSYYNIKKEVLGMYFLRFPKDVKEMSPITLSPFEDAAALSQKPKYEQIIDELHTKVRKPERTYVLREGIFEKNGDMTLIGESQSDEHITFSNSDMSPGHSTRSTTYVSYHYNDLIITRINPNGKILWLQYIPKRCNNYYSYKYVRRGEEHYFFYLEHADNDWDKHITKEVNFSKINVVMTRITAQGEMSKQMLINYKTYKLDMWYIFYSKIISPDEFTIGLRGKKWSNVATIKWK